MYDKGLFSKFFLRKPAGNAPEPVERNNTVIYMEEEREKERKREEDRELRAWPYQETLVRAVTRLCMVHSTIELLIATWWKAIILKRTNIESMRRNSNFSRANEFIPMLMRLFCNYRRPFLVIVHDNAGAEDYQWIFPCMSACRFALKRGKYLHEIAAEIEKISVVQCKCCTTHLYSLNLIIRRYGGVTDKHDYSNQPLSIISNISI